MTRSRKPRGPARPVFKSKWFSIDRIPFRADPVNPYYYRLTCSDCAAVLAMTPRRRIVLVRQFRPAVASMVTELPGGNIEAGETPATAAARELLEETGYQCDDLAPLGSLRIAQSRINNTVHLFFGIRARPVGGYHKPERGISVSLKSIPEFLAMVRDGRYAEFGGIASYSLSLIRGLL